MSDDHQERERLPAREGGYTTSRHRAVDGVGTEVDRATHAAYAADAHERDAQRRRELARPIAADLERIAAEVNSLRGQAKAVPGLMTEDARQCFKRIGRDLAKLRDALFTL